MKVLITGILGQDGSFLCEQLNHMGYEIHGIAKEVLSDNSRMIKLELDKQSIQYYLHKTNLYDFESVRNLIKEISPDEIYHMAAYHVSSEGKGNLGTIREQILFNNNVLATANLLESCLLEKPDCHIVTAGSCLMYDASNTFEQNEETRFHSNSLYGLAKITENQLVEYYRTKGLYACTAILYNHESHRRSSGFVTKKVVENMIKIKKKEINSFELGSLLIEKDWGFAGDYTMGMYLMLHNSKATDYVLATGVLHTVQDYVEQVAKYLGIDDWYMHININTDMITRKINGKLRGNSSKIERELNWKRTMGFNQLVENIVENVLEYMY
ncbi:MAG: GDP-mannose 4,6-dehydratase [Lachnospiraceae bacterium]|jgi:GDP-D-mannose dehydratase